VADGELKPCPKCGHVRTAADTNPGWQCPNCLIAYAKYQPGAAKLRSRLAAGGREMAAEAKSDHSVYALIAANLLALLIAWLTHMSLRELMIVYWIQSVIIGITHFFRILVLQKFSTDNVHINDLPVQETQEGKLKIALFFLVHYGGFHFGYSIFIELWEKHPGGSGIGYLLCTLVFATNHVYSMLHNMWKDAQGKPNIGALMFLPYARILPMHITILVGGSLFGGAVAFVVFGVLKVVADVAMHTMEHHLLARGSLLPREITRSDRTPGDAGS
jgi:hypothetical protein